MLNKFYNNQFAKLRENSVEFARENPAFAPMLGATSTDPDVSLLLQGVAYLNGLTLQKLEDEFPEIAQELAGVLAPQILRPMPSATMVVFEPKVPITERVEIPAGTELGANPVEGVSCVFNTTATLKVEPVTLAAASFAQTSEGVNTINLSFNGHENDQGLYLPANLRLFLADDQVSASYLLMLLRHHAKAVRVSDQSGRVVELSSRLAFPGFSEPLIPYPNNAFPGFSLIQELLLFPQKFLYVEFADLGKAAGQLRGSRFNIEIELDKSIGHPPIVTASSFLLNVTPVVNLFRQTAEPIQLTHEITEHVVTPDSGYKDFYQVYSIEKVIGMRQGVAQHTTYLPFSALTFQKNSRQASYRPTLRPSLVNERLDTYISVAYPPDSVPVSETLSIQLVCTNRALPEQLKLGDICRPTSSSPDRFNFSNILPLTPAVDPPSGERLLWAVISHTVLNILSLNDVENLRSLLRLYNSMRTQDHAAKAMNDRQIDGMIALRVTPESRLYRGMNTLGQRVRLICEGTNWGGAGSLYLWGCVLEKFLANYAGINSYIRFELEDTITGVVYKWPLRQGLT